MSLVSLASWDLQISSLVSPALPWLLSSMLSSFRALVFVAIVFLVVDFEPHSVGFIQAVGYDFNFLPCTVACLVTQHVICPRECPVCP